MIIKLILIITVCFIPQIKSDEICIDVVNDQTISVSFIEKEDWLISAYPVCASFNNQINQTG